MSMMTQQILKSVNLTKTQKCRYLENKTIFFSKKKKIINCTSRANLLQKKICSGGNVWQKITESNKKQNC